MTTELQQAAENMRTAVRSSIRRRRFLYLIQACLLIIAGLIALFFPLVTTSALVQLVGWLLIASGVIHGIGMIGAQNVPHFWLQLFSIVLGIVMGVLIVTHPAAGLLFVTLFLVAYLMIEGVSKIVFSLTVRPLRNWGWVMISGVIAIGLGVVLWATMPYGSAWLISILLGVTLLVEGLSLAAMALGAGRLSRAASEAVATITGEEARPGETSRPL